MLPKIEDIRKAPNEETSSKSSKDEELATKLVEMAEKQLSDYIIQAGSYGYNDVWFPLRKGGVGKLTLDMLTDRLYKAGYNVSVHEGDSGVSYIIRVSW